MNVAVVGASGFVGGVTCRYLAAAGHRVVAVGRTLPRDALSAHDARAVGPFEGVADWSVPLRETDAVVYLAARVHVMRDRDRDPLNAYRAVNTHAAVRAAEGAARAGAKRFVYISSIKVNGESTEPGRPFDEHSPPAPSDPYAESKHEAETALAALGAASGMSVVSLRPPMVFGAGARGNVPRLARLARIAARIPLPLASVHNRRSLLYVEHFADAIARVATSPHVLAPCYVIADPTPVSTVALLDAVGSALGVRPKFFSAPPGLLVNAAKVAGLASIADRLLGSLEIDASALRKDAGWSSPISLGEAMRRTFAPDITTP